MSRSRKHQPFVKNGTGGIGGTAGRRLRWRQYRRVVRQAIDQDVEVLPDVRELESCVSDVFCREYKVWNGYHFTVEHWERK